MNIDRKQAQPILSRKVTQLRFPGDRDEAPAKYAEGQKHPLKFSGGGERLCGILLTAAFDQRLEDATDEDAQREGHRNAAALIHAWRKPLCSWTLSPEAVMFRVVRFTLDIREPARIPAEQQGKLHPAQYTSSSLGALATDPGEAVPDSVQNLYAAEGLAKSARLRADQEKRQEIRRLTARIRQLQVDADKKGVDLTPKIHSIARQVEDAENELRDAA